jgi:hypothetical protein
MIQNTLVGLALVAGIGWTTTSLPATPPPDDDPIEEVTDDRWEVRGDPQGARARAQARRDEARKDAARRDATQRIRERFRELRQQEREGDRELQRDALHGRLEAVREGNLQEERAREFYHELQARASEHVEQREALEQYRRLTEERAGELSLWREFEDRRGNRRGEELERRIAHLHAATENLHAGGFREMAEKIGQEREELERHLQSMLHEESAHRDGGMQPRIDRLEEEVHELRREVHEMRKMIEELRDHLMARPR